MSSMSKHLFTCGTYWKGRKNQCVERPVSIVSVNRECPEYVLELKYCV